MITTLKLSNFKCFEAEQFVFRPLTVFCGGNASGKSTAIQSLLLLRQSYESGHLNSNRLQLNGKLFSVGMVRDLLPFNRTSRSVCIEIVASDNGVKYEFSFPPGEPIGYSLILESREGEENSLFTCKFTYLSAERLGPRNLYDISQDLIDDLDVGVAGQFTAAVLEAKGSDIAPNSILGKDSTLLTATKAWMQKIIPGLDISSQVIPESDKVMIKFNNTGMTGQSVRPINTGFGISYTLPIVVAALLKKPGDILIIENPEAHLHPSAQSMLGQFIGAIYQSGVQVIIETHSDHIINGLRIFVKQNPKSSKDIIINSLQLSEDGRRMKDEVELDTDGNLTLTPPTFFDQIAKDLFRLF